MHRKAEEHAHNEILAFSMTALGVNLLIGGLLVIIMVAGETSWFLSFPYASLQIPPAYLGLILTTAGFVILAAGFTLVMYYDRRRAWYMKEIEKSSIRKEKGVLKSADEILEEYTGQKKRR
jgi:cytochrome c biogenesis factor